MNSFLTVNNNVSLISITVTPSTFLAAFLILVVFLAIYLSQLSLSLPRFNLPLSWPFRSWTRTAQPLSPSELVSSSPHRYDHKPLPDAPSRDARLILRRDQSLLVARKDVARLKSRSSSYWRRNSSKRDRITAESDQDSDDCIYSPTSSNDENVRTQRRHRRLLDGLRTPTKSLSQRDTSRVPTSPSRQQRITGDERGSPGSPGARGGRPRAGSPGLGLRFRRWVFASSVAETRQRRPQQRLLEGPA
jgi:hypothetical protein